MTNMHTVGMREFRENVHKYKGDVDMPITVTSHGQTVGYYIPARIQPRQADFDSLRETVTRMAGVLEEIGVSEDEIIDDFKKSRKNKHTPK